MKLNRLIIIQEAIELLIKVSDTDDVSKIIHALTGVCWSGEDAWELIESYQDKEAGR